MTLHRSTLKRALGGIIVALLAGELMLLFGGARVLLNERKVQPGEHYVVEEHGDLGQNNQASLVCTFFDGRKRRVTVYWYSSANVFGRDACPFIDRR
jgi:hypothetical protein